MIKNTEEAIDEVQWLLDEMECSGGELYGDEYNKSLNDILAFLKGELEK